MFTVYHILWFLEIKQTLYTQKNIYFARPAFLPCPHLCLFMQKQLSCPDTGERELF